MRIKIRRRHDLLIKNKWTYSVEDLTQNVVNSPAVGTRDRQRAGFFRVSGCFFLIYEIRRLAGQIKYLAGRRFSAWTFCTGLHHMWFSFLVSEFYKKQKNDSKNFRFKFFIEFWYATIWRNPEAKETKIKYETFAYDNKKLSLRKTELISFQIYYF